MGAAGATEPWAQRTSRPFQAGGTNMAYCAPLLTPSCSSAAFGEWLAAVTAGMPRSVRVRKQRPRVRFIACGLLADAAPPWGERCRLGRKKSARNLTSENTDA